MTINPCFFTPKVIQYVDGLITDYSSYQQLTNSDKCEFASYLIEASGRSAESEFLTESNHLDQIIGAFKNALRGTSKDDENFISTIKENTVRYFNDTMWEIFDDRKEELARCS